MKIISISTEVRGLEFLHRWPNLTQKHTFDITTVNVKEKTDAERAHMWTLYEEAVEYVKDNSETMHPISEFDLGGYAI